MLLIFFYTPKKHRFLIFSGGIERDPGMKWVNKFVSQHTEETNQIKLKKIRFRNSKSGSYLGKLLPENGCAPKIGSVQIET